MVMVGVWLSCHCFEEHKNKKSKQICGRPYLIFLGQAICFGSHPRAAFFTYSCLFTPMYTQTLYTQTFHTPTIATHTFTPPTPALPPRTAR